MNINATLIAQIVHFFIAYALIRRFFLRPTVALILEENAHRAHLHQTLELGTELCVHKQELQKKQWLKFQEKWQKLIPDLSLYAHNKAVPEFYVEQPSQEHVQQEVRSAVSYIKERVNDAL